ncbi:hypothetical protein [Bartonella sp. CB60]
MLKDVIFGDALNEGEKAFKKDACVDLVRTCLGTDLTKRYV